MEQVLLVVQVLIAIALIGMVLIQRSESDGFGLSGGSGNNLLSGRGTANLMTRTTAILAALFIINSLALSVVAVHGRSSSIVDQIQEDAAKDGAPAVPVAGEDKAAPKLDKKKADVKVEEAAPKVPVAGDETKAEKKAEAKVDAPVSDAEKAAEPVKKAKPVKKIAPKVTDEQPAEETDNNE